MIICLCNEISDRDIRACAAKGATCCQQVYAAKGGVMRCGSCVRPMRDIIRETRACPEARIAPAVPSNRN